LNRKPWRRKVVRIPVVKTCLRLEAFIEVVEEERR